MAGHGHGHGHCADEHEHDDDPERGRQFSLYTKIHKDNVECLNETIDGSGKEVFKPWDQRMDKEKVVESDADEELLFNIPFTGNVKLKGIIVIGGEHDYHPAEMKLYKNQEHMTFDDTSIEPEQVFEMQPDVSGRIEYCTKIAKFSSVHHLSIYFPRNFGADTTKVYYIGLRGEFTEAQRQQVLITNYELSANPADHKTNLMENARHEIS